ncbi:hypothetical protein [Sphingomonas sp. LHG3406-1]|uniref:hypothetical protein n=1 Tax=Sphingomonas sp. LHG3406-1 TaxID=2804617 RepID=UPI0026295E34|nr:hypothetical protein [Sphingomonas sp. LHG3406-1]
MTLLERLAAIRNTRMVQSMLFVLGMILLFVAAPLASPLPGPGGLLLAAAGLTLVLRTSLWAKRRYVHFKRWQPRAGTWFDWGLRRGSAKRREALRKERERAEAPPLSEVPRIDDPLPKAGLELSPVDPTPAEVAPAEPAPRH